MNKVNRKTGCLSDDGLPDLSRCRFLLRQLLQDKIADGPGDPVVPDLAVVTYHVVVEGVMGVGVQELADNAPPGTSPTIQYNEMSQLANLTCLRGLQGCASPRVEVLRSGQDHMTSRNAEALMAA